MPRALANVRACASLICNAQRDQRAKEKHPNNSENTKKKKTKKPPKKQWAEQKHMKKCIYIYIKTQMAQSIGVSPITYYCNKQHSKWSQNRVWTLHTLIRDMMTKVIWC